MAALPAEGRPPGVGGDLSPRTLATAFACLAGMMLGNAGFATGAIALIMTPVGDEFGWGRGAIGAAVTAMTFAGAGSLFLVGRRVDRSGARGLVIIMALLMGSALAILAFSTPVIAQFYAGFMLVGVAGGANVAYTKVVSSLFTRHRGKALAVFAIEASLVSAAMPVLMQQLMVSLGWRGIFLGLGLLEFLVVLPLLLWLMRDPMEEARRAAAASAPPVLDGLTTSEGLETAPFWMILARQHRRGHGDLRPPAAPGGHDGRQGADR